MKAHAWFLQLLPLSLCPGVLVNYTESRQTEMSSFLRGIFDEAVTILPPHPQAHRFL